MRTVTPSKYRKQRILGVPLPIPTYCGDAPEEDAGASSNPTAIYRQKLNEQKAYEQRLEYGDTEHHVFTPAHFEGMPRVV